jgi:hypothetical protein
VCPEQEEFPDLKAIPPIVPVPIQNMIVLDFPSEPMDDIDPHILDPVSEVMSGADRSHILSHAGSLPLSKHNFDVEYDLAQWKRHLSTFSQSYHKHNVQGLIAAIMSLTQAIKTNEILPYDLEYELHTSHFFEMLFDSFKSELPGVIQSGILFLTFLASISDSIVTFLFENDHLEHLFCFLDAGNCGPSLFLLFANAVETAAVFECYADRICALLTRVFTTDCTFPELSSALRLCHTITSFPIDFSFVYDLISFFQTQLAVFSGDASAAIGQSVLGILSNFCDAEVPETMLSPREALEETGTLSCLLGLLPVMSPKLHFAAIGILRRCFESLENCRCIEFLELEPLISMMETVDGRVVSELCDFFAVLVRIDARIVAGLLEGGVVDVFLRCYDEGLPFGAIKSFFALLTAMLLVEEGDSVFEPIVRPEIVELALELYETNANEVPGLFGVLARLHILTFEIPEVDGMLREVVEGSYTEDWL